MRRLGWLSEQNPDLAAVAKRMQRDLMGVEDAVVAERAGGGGGRAGHGFGALGGRGRGAGKRRHRGIPVGGFGAAHYACPPGSRWSPRKSRCVSEEPDFRGLDRAMMRGSRGGEA